MKKLGKQAKQIQESKARKSRDAEIRFEELCKRKGIKYVKLDSRKSELRSRVLLNPKGKSPDYLCSKNQRSLFVEVKTLTNLTNEAREREMEQMESGKIYSFDPKPEFRTPLKTKLVRTSDKFKNIKSIKTPRILVLSGFFGESEFYAKAVLLGAYQSYGKKNGKLVDLGFIKKENGLLDEVGGNISAVVYWNEEKGFYEGFGNPKAKIEFVKSDFYLFFGNI